MATNGGQFGRTRWGCSSQRKQLQVTRALGADMCGTKTTSGIFKVAREFAEFKPRWRLLGLCLVFRFSRVYSSRLAKTEDQGLEYFSHYVWVFLEAKKAGIKYMM